MSAPLATPFRIATGQHDALTNVFLHLRINDGLDGYGEAAVAPHITGESVVQTLANLQAAATALVGRKIVDIVALSRELAPAFAGNHAGLAAVEMALFDLAARCRGVPLYQLFSTAAGHSPRLGFATDITVVIGTLDEARCVAQRYAEQGFESFKIKIGRDETLDLERVRAVHDIAPQSRLILDANMGFDARRMLAFLDRLAGRGIHPVLLEQPVPKADWNGLSAITRALDGSGTLVCADESVGSLDSARRAIDSGAVNAINVKSMKSGFLEGVAIARLAAFHGLSLMLGAMMESSLSITASAHLVAGLGCVEFIDLDTTFFLTGEMARSPYLDAHGRFDLSSAGAGIGVTPPLS